MQIPFPNVIKLIMYVFGLAAVGYLAYMIMGDVMMATAVVVVSNWLKPFRA